MGMPPVRLRTSSAKSRTWRQSDQSGKRGGETAGVPSGRPRTWAILPVTLWPGRCPPVPVLAPCPPLKWKACTSSSLSQEKPKRPEAYS